MYFADPRPGHDGVFAELHGGSPPAGQPPDGQPQPLVSTLNAQDGAITSNMAIVPSTNHKVDAFASGLTNLILDVSSYFAP